MWQNAPYTPSKITLLLDSNPNFPMYLWDQVVKQAEITLNLMRQFCLNPKLSAYAQIQGAFNYNGTPLAPPSTCIVAHKKPSQQASWATHGVNRWHIRPALEHYQCHQVYILSTRSECIVDMLEFFLTKSKMPAFSSANAANKAALNLTKALCNPYSAAPFAPISNKWLDAISKLVDIFHDTLLRVGEANKRTNLLIANSLQDPQPAIAHCTHSHTTNIVMENKTTLLKDILKQAPNPNASTMPMTNAVISSQTSQGYTTQAQHITIW